jgi:GH43 family beta-xylosidase
MRHCSTLAWGLFALAIGLFAQSSGTFLNPVLPSGPDPWVIFHDGFYYYMNSTGNNLTIWKTRSIADLKTAEKHVVWTPPETGPYSHDIWAPELHWINHRWYIYFAADAGANVTHRIWVLENSGPDPCEGTWTLKGKLGDPGDHWAIDGSVFENRGRLFFIWSGWDGSVNGTQNIYIAELSNPWTMKGDRVKLSSPEYPWEKAGDLPERNGEDNPGGNRIDPIHVDVNEGPEILQHAGKVFLIYSASGCWTDYYELGMLTASADSDLLKPSSWKKSSLPVFWESPSAGAYGTGHNGFFQSPDGKEDWIIFHANPASGQGCGGRRAPHAQPFHWKADGTPDFGRPIPLDTPLKRPSGEVQ